MPTERTITILRRLASVVAILLGGVAVLLLVAGDYVKELAGPRPDLPEFQPAPSDSDLPEIAESGGVKISIVKEKPPITQIMTVLASEIVDQIEDDELVIGVVVDGQARAYAINIMTYPQREVFNDTLGGRSIAATW
jgi:hypothetical protein